MAIASGTIAQTRPAIHERAGAVCYKSVVARLALYPIAAVGLTGAAFNLVKTGRDALYFKAQTLDALPIAYLWIELGLFVAAYVHLAAMRRWGTRRARTTLFFGCALAAGAVAPWAASPGVAMLLFPAVPVAFAALFSAGWLLASDLLDDEDQRFLARAYAQVGASAMIGGIAGSLAGGLFSRWIPAAGLIALGGALLAVAGVVIARGHAAKPAADPAPSGPLPSIAAAGDWDRAILKQPYVRIVFGISALAALVGMVVEFQFYAVAIETGRADAAFFARYYLLLSVASLVLQLLVAPRVQSRFGVGVSLLVLPIGVLGGAGMVIAASSVITQTLCRVVENGLKNSIHRSSWEQVFLPFPREARSALKVMADGLVPRTSGVIGALVLWWVVARGGPDALRALAILLAIALLIAAAGWLFLTIRLRKLGCEVSSGEVEIEIRLPDT